ncbi:acyltransferase [uncultured Shimia sp.]|uniref:acyltransferase n=1 Tax=uncultured Shimia sp. TaxID=573152 RepID=UPI0025DEF141|nr:acyltransferase [uncultured Shimia sp.]
MSETLVEYDLAELVPDPQRHLCQDSVLVASPKVISRIAVSLSPAPGLRKNYRIEVSQSDFRGKLRFSLGPGRGKVQIHSRGPLNLDVRMWRNSSLSIGNGTTINKAKIVCDNADIFVGEDGLWSGDILVQSNDQHGIIDLNTMAVINSGRRSVQIEDHVWVGRQTIVMPDVRIGKGSILAAGAILTTNMPENSIFAGVPARKVRGEATWSRAPAGLSDSEFDLLGIEGGKSK